MGGDGLEWPYQMDDVGDMTALAEDNQLKLDEGVSREAVWECECWTAK